MTDWSTYTDEELAQAAMEIDAERQRRYTLVTVPEQMTALNQDYLAAEGTEQGEPWRQPSGSHDAYPLDWVVTHVEKTWQSLMDGNVWEPGVSGWREVGEEWPAWVQPTGAHDDYDMGAQVSHVDKHWTSDVNANVWEPGVYGWTEVP